MAALDAYGTQAGPAVLPKKSRPDFLRPCRLRSIGGGAQSRAVVLRTRYESKRAIANRRAVASRAFLPAYSS